MLSVRRTTPTAREEVGGQLRALQENGLDGGFMAWNAMCSIPKFETLKPAFDALPD